MTLIGWSYLGSFADPRFIIATLLFLVIGALIATQMTSLAGAAEVGAIYGYVYGVVVWGSLGYYYRFDGQIKLLFSGCAIFDGVILVAACYLLLRRIEARRESAA